jgi:hypothetical protein
MFRLPTPDYTKFTFRLLLALASGLVFAALL